jgi:xanthine dehydrogenase large subunit
VHSSVRHDSAAGHTNGQALYLDDIPVVPGTLETALVLSPYPPARIVSIDVAAALAAEGVTAVVTSADIPGKNDIAPIRTDEPLLAAGLVEHEGQIVAAVAAATLDHARAAAKLVKVEYKVLPAVLSVEEAVAKELYVAPVQTMERGDIDAALKSAPYRLAGEFRCGGQDHFYLEGQIALATPGEGHDIHVYSSTQHPTEVQHGVAHVLGIPHGRRLRRQGKPADHYCRDRRAACLEDAQAGQVAAAARRRHARHRQTPSVLLPLRCRLRR